MSEISVVVLSYNSSATITETLDSIANQSFKDVEIIITDDCSKDNTIEIVKEWFVINEINGIIVTSDVNTGVSANANRGIRASTCEMVFLIAGDDILMSNALEVYYEYYNLNPDVLWMAKCKHFGGDSERMKRLDDFVNQKWFFELDNTRQYVELCCNNYICAPSLGLIKKSIFQEIGFFDEKYRMVEDHPFNIRASKKGYCFRLIDEVLVKYRQSNSSITGTCSREYAKDCVKYFFELRFSTLLKNRKFLCLVKCLVDKVPCVFGYRVSKDEKGIHIRKL